MPYEVTFYNNERKLRVFTRNRCVKNVNKGSQLKQSMYMFQNSSKCRRIMKKWVTRNWETHIGYY